MPSANIKPNTRSVLSRRRRSRFIDRLRFQIATCLIVAVGIPYLIGVLAIPNFTSYANTVNSLVGSILAIVGGYWFYRGLSSFPGLRASAHILPTFTATFAIVLAVLFIGRFPYNRLLIVAGFVNSVLWLLLVTSLTHRARPLRVGVVAAGRDVLPERLPDIIWVELTNPEEQAQVDAIVADFRHDLSNEWNRRLTEYALAGTPVYHVKQLQESVTGRVELEQLSENSLGTLIPSPSYLAIKQCLDRITALIALVLLSPFLLVCVVLIRLDSPGPAIFRQQRVGFRGRLFTVFKLRTMSVGRGANDPLLAAQTQVDDERITRFGKVARKLRLDELPQLVNVIRGDMSLIGPRPEMVVLSRWYEREIPFYRYRHIVMPGITGWAQVNQGHVVDVADITDKLHYDFYYVKNFSPWIDILVLVRTITTVFSGFGHR